MICDSKADVLTPDDIMNGWEALANAVVIQVVEDYRSTCQKLHSCSPTSETARRAKAAKSECEAFFYSDRFAIYTNVDPSYILSRLEDENERMEPEFKRYCW